MTIWRSGATRTPARTDRRRGECTLDPSIPRGDRQGDGKFALVDNLQSERESAFPTSRSLAATCSSATMILLPVPLPAIHHEEVTDNWYPIPVNTCQPNISAEKITGNPTFAFCTGIILSMSIKFII